MGTVKYPSHAEISELTPEERLLLIEDVWVTLASHPDSLPLNEDHKQEIDFRLAEWRRSGATGSAWPDVRDRITRRK